MTILKRPRKLWLINKTNDELFLLLGQNVGQLKSLNFSDYNFFEHYDQIL